ncbi:hypothetical protein V8F20_004178 [Naviculisporaceae sp. PSN 640]
MSIKNLFAALAVAASSNLFYSPALAQGLSKCGEATFYDNEYTCYNDKTLCPTVYGLPTKPCGATGGCYSPERHSCDAKDGTLRDLPEATSPFTLAVWGVRKAYQNKTINACGGMLAFGANARQCVVCTAAGGTNCGSYKNQTVFLPNGQMNSAVPGGQYWYVHPSEGLLQYTPAIELPKGNGTAAPNWNTTVIPYKDFAGVNVKVYEDGFFTWDKEGTSSRFWFACLVTLPGGTISTARSWRIYAPLTPDLKDCELVRIKAKPVDKSFGAYKYS